MVDKAIVVRIVGDAGQFVGAMTTAGASVQTMGNQAAAGAAKATASVNSLGKAAATVGKVTVIGVAAGLALSAKAAIDFESAFAGVRKTVDASEATFDSLAMDIRDLSTTIPIAATELARIGELGGQLGVDAGGLPSFIETIAKLGVTTTLSTEQAALGFARLDNIMQLGQNSFEQMGSAIVDLGNNFATTEDEILTFALRVAPVGKTVGLAVDEVLAIATAFSSVGIPAERGGTAIQKAFIAISESAANGGAKLQVFAETAGMTTVAFKDLVKSDPAKAFESFVVGLRRVNQEGGNVFAILDQVGLGSARVVNSLLGMANASDVLTDALNLSEEAFEANIALTEEAEKRFATTASKITLAKNQITDFAIGIGNELLPVIGNLADDFQDLVFGFQSADPVIKKLVGGMLGLIAGATLAQGAYKILARIVGVDFVAAAGRGALAAGLLKGAIGLGLVVALGFVIKKFIDFGQGQRDAKLRVDALVDSLAEERQGIEGVTLAQVKAQLVADGYRDTLLNIGIGIDTFARATMGEAAALKIVQTRIDEVTGRLKVFDDEQKALIAGEMRFGEEIQANKPAMDAYNQELEDLTIVKNLLQSGTDTYNIALAEEQKQYEAIARSNALDLIAQGIDTFDQNARSAAQAADGVVDSFSKIIVPAELTADQVDAASEAIEDYKTTLVDAFSETSEELSSQIDFWGELGNAVVINVDDIIKNVNEQVATQGELIGNLGGFDISNQTREFFTSMDLEFQAGLNNLAKNAPDDFKALLDYYDFIFGPTGAVAQNAHALVTQQLPEIMKMGGTEMVAAFRSVAEEVATTPGVDPVEAWLGTMQSALLSLPEEARPAIAEALREAFAGSGFSGTMFGLGGNAMQGFIDGMYSMFPDLARVMFGVRNTVVAVTKGGFILQSPSKLMEGYGMLVGEGFAIGLNKGVQGLHNFGQETLGISNRHHAIAGSTSSVTNNNSDSKIDLQIHGSKNTGQDAQALLLAANLIGAA